MVTFSVMISTNGSSRDRVAPARLIQRTISPSTTDSASSGIGKILSTACENRSKGEDAANGRDDAFCAGQIIALEIIRDRRVDRRDADDRRFQILDCFFRDERRDLACERAQFRRFDDDDKAPGFPHAPQNRLAVVRDDRSQIEHVGIDAALDEHVSSILDDFRRSLPYATIVTSPPARIVRATPSGIASARSADLALTAR